MGSNPILTTITNLSEEVDEHGSNAVRYLQYLWQFHIAPAENPVCTLQKSVRAGSNPAVGVFYAGVGEQEDPLQSSCRVCKFKSYSLYHASMME